MANAGNTTITEGEIQFFDNYIPSLDDDKYTLTLEASIDQGSKGSGPIDTESYFENPVTMKFQVRGPRFSLDKTEVHGVYPPNNSNGVYGRVMPHIVLNKRELPWERIIATGESKSVPWLALMVFKEGEIAVDKTTNSTVTNATVKNLLSPVTDVIKPDIKSSDIDSDVLQSTCQTISISADAFQALAPLKVDLAHLAHVRQVTTIHQVNTDTDDLGWFSIVLGNRILDPGTTGCRFYVHLVSMEGFGGYIDNNPPNAQGKQFQMVSLYNWTFVSEPQVGESFAELATNFVTQANGLDSKLLLKREVTEPHAPTPAMTKAFNRVNNGYTALAYQAPSGEETFAWYRGPLTPVVPPPITYPSTEYRFPAASSAMIYDKDTGIFDQSYGAAWSIGRALALADRSFAQSLLSYRQKSYRLLGKIVDYLKGKGEATPTDLQKIVQAKVTRDAFDKLLEADIGTQLTSLFTGGGDANTKGEVAAGGGGANGDTHAVTLTKQYLATPEVQAIIQGELKEELIPIAKWLARKQLLYDLPFNHIVPDQEMLPVESLRFFYVDQIWLDVLVDGALSVGVQSSKDSFTNHAMKGVISDAVMLEIKSMRSKLLGTATGAVEPDSTKQAISGILVRSAMVSGWPGLVVKAYKSGTPLKTLRMNRLSANILLCLFLDIPDTVTLSEPEQGLRFGVEAGAVAGDDNIDLRQLNSDVGKPVSPVTTFPAAGGFEQFYRAAVNNVGGTVLNVNNGTSSVVQSLAAQSILGTASITPSDFAIEMVKAPEQLLFKPAS